MNQSVARPECRRRDGAESPVSAEALPDGCRSEAFAEDLPAERLLEVLPALSRPAPRASGRVSGFLGLALALGLGSLGN
jgi:hypothetical protein